MNESYHDDLGNDTLGAVEGRLWKLQDELDYLENKLSKSLLSLGSLLEEKEDNNPVEDTLSDCEIPQIDLGEDGVRQRTATMNLTNEEAGPKTDRLDDLLTDVKTIYDFSRKHETWKPCDYWSLPKWLQVNNFILKGYRPPLPSFKMCVYSVFRVHTETVNIWSHLLGCLLFVILFLHAWLGPFPLHDKIVLSPFFLGAILCLGMSCAFHTLHCHSERVMSLFSRFDYLGINFLIVGSFVPWLVYGFSCHPTVKVMYLAGVSFLGVCSGVLSLSETFSEPLYRPLRATVFVVFGLFGVVPTVHLLLTVGFNTIALLGVYLLITAILYIAGAFIYAARVPERIFLGKCDILFQSHQLFHVLVVLATLFNYFGIMKVAEFVQFERKNTGYCKGK